MSMGEDSACIYEYGWRQCLYLWVWVKTVLVSMSMGEDSACIYEYEAWRLSLRDACKVSSKVANKIYKNTNEVP